MKVSNIELEYQACCCHLHNNHLQLLPQTDTADRKGTALCETEVLSSQSDTSLKVMKQYWSEIFLQFF